MPSQMWDKIRLDKNYANALRQVDEELQYVVSEALIHKIKQRLTKLTQSLIRYCHHHCCDAQIVCFMLTAVFL